MPCSRNGAEALAVGLLYAATLGYVYARVRSTHRLAACVTVTEKYDFMRKGRPSACSHLDD